MEAVDFSAFLSVEFELLAKLAEKCGQADLASEAQTHHLRLNALINERLWSDQAGCYLDYDLQAQALSPVVAVSTFLPLLCGAANESQVDSLEALVRDPKAFGTLVPLPSIARNDPTYKPDMWCGPVWINLAWTAVVGFERYGRHELAQELKARLCRGIERQYAEFGTIFEFFDPDEQIPPPKLLRKGRLAPEVSPYHQVFHDFGWTAALYIDMQLAKEPALPARSPSLGVVLSKDPLRTHNQ